MSSLLDGGALVAMMPTRWSMSVVLFVTSAVAVALLSLARAPPDSASATRELIALGKSSAVPSGAPSTNPTKTPTPVPTAASTEWLAPIPRPAPSASAASTPSAAPTAASTPPADDGTISTPPSAAGHRVFVDGRYAGDSPGPIKVRCGQHVVKVGSGGTPHSVDVPCGGDALVSTP